MNRIPKKAASFNKFKRPTPVAKTPDLSSAYPCWRIRYFDLEGRWGLSSLLGGYTFSFNEDLLRFCVESDDENLYSALEKLDKKSFMSSNDFWDSLRSLYGSNLPIDIIKVFNSFVTRNVLFEKIFPKLKSFESNTWDEILKYTHNDGKSNNHEISISKISKEAQDRLSALKLDDYENIFSLRLEGKIRIYGFRDHNCLDIIWVDLNHEVCPSLKS